MRLCTQHTLARLLLSCLGHFYRGVNLKFSRCELECQQKGLAHSTVRQNPFSEHVFSERSLQQKGTETQRVQCKCFSPPCGLSSVRTECDDRAISDRGSRRVANWSVTITTWSLVTKYLFTDILKVNNTGGSACNEFSNFVFFLCDKARKHTNFSDIRARSTTAAREKPCGIV